MPTTTWNIVEIDGKDWLVMDVAKFKVPLDWDPSSNMFFAVAVPDGGLGSLPVLAQGDPGVTPDIDTVVDLDPLDWDDATPASAGFTETSPNVYRLDLALHEGAPGADGTSELDPDAYGTPVHKKQLQVNATADGFEYITPKVGDRHGPASINNTPSGNAAYTLCSVSVAAQDFDWRPHVEGYCVITGTGADVRVDLLARLQVGAVSAETSGNIVGRAVQAVAGQNPPTHVLSAGPHAGAADSYDKVPAGETAVIYLRAERQSGGDTFTTSNSTTRFNVWVEPVP